MFYGRLEQHCWRDDYELLLHHRALSMKFRRFFTRLSFVLATCLSLSRPLVKGHLLYAYFLQIPHHSCYSETSDGVPLSYFACFFYSILFYFYFLVSFWILLAARNLLSDICTLISLKSFPFFTNFNERPPR
jgi:hypothetical protein